MQQKRRFILGLLVFALLLFSFGVRTYFVFFHEGSYDGWSVKFAYVGSPFIVTGIDPDGAMTALQVGDQVLAVNGISPRDDSTILNFADRVPPGTAYTITVQRNGQSLVFPIVTKPLTTARYSLGEKFYVFIFLIFLLTGLSVFLLKPDDKQAWLLAMMLGTFTALNQWNMPVGVLGRTIELIVALVNLIGLCALPLLLQFFLIFPHRSPLLQRWPRLEQFLYWPLILFVLPSFGGNRLPGYIRGWYFQQSWIAWLIKNVWTKLTMPVVLLYLAGGLVALAVNYRVANQDARRRLRVIMVGSGLGFLTLLLVIIGESFNLQNRARLFAQAMQISVLVTAPLIPLSFAYAIIRHKVIPVSLIIRRGVRYLLVSRGSMLLVIIGVGMAGWFLLDGLFRYFAINDGRVVGTLSAIVAIIGWHYTWTFHQRIIAPAIDRRFFRQAYDAQQIMTELADELRSTTNRAELLELGATKIQSALQTEHVTILLPDEMSKEYRSAYSRSYNGTPDIRLAHDDAIVQRLLISNQPLELDEATKTLPASLLLPLKGKNDLSGIVALGARRGDLPFSNEDKQLLLSVGAPMSFALENTRLIEQMIEDARRREELEAENEARAKELEEARQLQLSMLPKKVPQIPNLEIAAYMKTATEVGGDYYDFHVADDDTLTIAIGDATGHGLKAGTVVTATKSLFNELADEEDLPLMLKRFSHSMKKMNLRSLFMALTVARLKQNSLTITVAGMPPILIYRASQQNIEEVFIKAMPLGCVPSYNYKQEEVALASGDIVVLMSDGFPERFNPANEMLGYDQAKQTLAGSAQLSSQEILARLVQIGDDWGQSRLADDDVTFVVLKIR